MTSDSHGDHTDRQRTGQELRLIAARLGLDSASKIADAINEDRGMVGRVLRGEDVSARKWDTVEAKIRALDEEMGSERSEHEQRQDDIVEIRATGNFGVDIVVRGPVSDLEQLEDAVYRLVKKMGGGASGSASGTGS